MYIVPSLGDQAPGTYVNGSVAIYNDKNEMVSRIEVTNLYHICLSRGKSKNIKVQTSNKENIKKVLSEKQKGKN